MSNAAQPIYNRPDDLAAIQHELRALGLSAKTLYVVTQDHPSSAVTRSLAGALIPGVRSLGDSLNKLEQAIAAGAPGIDFTKRSNT